MAVFLSVIVVTYPPKRKELSFCLKYLLQQTYKKFEVIVVSDGIDKDSEKLAAGYQQYFNIRYFERENDQCLSRSRNIGAVQAGYDFIVIIDSDILLNPDALENYAKEFEKEKQISVWGNYGYSLVRKRAEAYEEIETIRDIFKDKGLKEYIENNPQTPLLPCKPFFFCWGGNFAIDKKTYLDTGGSDESLVKWGGEDTELAYRLYLKKHEFRFSASTWGEHMRHEKIGSFYEMEGMSPGLLAVGHLIEPEKKLYYSTAKNIIIAEWEKLIGLLENKTFGQYYLEQYLKEIEG